MHLARLLANLSAEKYEKHLVLIKGGGSYESQLDVGTKVHLLEGAQSSSSTKSLFKSIVPLSKMLKLLQPDIFFSIMDHVNVFAYPAWRLAGKPGKMIVSVQTSIEKAIGFAPKNKFLRFVRMATLFVYPKVNRIVSLSYGVSDELVIKHPSAGDRISTIHNFGLAAIKNTPKKKSEGELKIVICGRLIRLKGFDTVIKAVSIAAKEIPSISLIVLGTGPELDNLGGLADNLGIGDKVFFEGFVTEPEQYFVESDIFILSSHYEGFGNVIIEAMSVGCPVISTDCPYGPAEIINRPDIGMLVPVDDAEAMAQAIIEVAGNPDNYEKLSKGAIQRAKDFLPVVIAEQYDELFLKEFQQ